MGELLRDAERVRSWSDMSGYTGVAGRLRSVLAIDVPLQLVFDSPTVASMAAALRHDGPPRDRPGDEAAPVPLGVNRAAWTTEAHGTLSLSDG